MKRHLALALLLSNFLSLSPVFAESLQTSCEQLFQAQDDRAKSLQATETATAPSSESLKFKTEVDLNQFTGISFLAMMKEQVKPRLDKYAEDGFTVASVEDVVAALDKVSSKVKSQALKAAGGLESLKKVVTALQGQNVNLYNLPEKIAAAHIPGVNRYSLSTFLSLASGGGVALRLNETDVSYNVNYGIGRQAKDEMTGRSFGEGPEHLADDASDKSYLQSLQRYFSSETLNTNEFYKSLLQILTNSDASGLKKVSPDGQSVMSDFLAIYVAEQDRHLMSDLSKHAWDVALLEVTLLSAFHAGQSKFMVMFGGQLVDKVPKQAPGGEPRTDLRDANMTDWWQFSSNPDPASKNRSGINVTKKDFRALGSVISDYMRKEHADLVQNVERHFPQAKAGGNIFQKLSDFLINKNAPRSLSNAEELATDFGAFLDMVRQEANNITTQRLQFQMSLPAAPGK